MLSCESGFPRGTRSWQDLARWRAARCGEMARTPFRYSGCGRLIRPRQRAGARTRTVPGNQPASAAS